MFSPYVNEQQFPLRFASRKEKITTELAENTERFS
ncbi:hypothetical protein SCG7086_AP_00150 [Chlamydiales bacterium SCGC AG-110-P3]|nr:hypothetical protein SCG7086_AP_00150 [Chlamydiales bacterium SCGC AG-110-P3]